MPSHDRPSTDRPAHDRTVRLGAAAAGAIGIAGLLAGCSGSDDATAKDRGTATTAESSTTTTAAGSATTAAPAGTPTASAAPTPPSGAQQLQTDGTNGATYWRYSITGTSAQQVVADYQQELAAQGYTVTDQGGGGGGWGKWGGAGAGLTADKGGTYISVQAGGQSSGPVYFEVCSGPSAQSVQDCENVSDGPDDQNQNQNQNDQGDSTSGGS